MLATLQSEISTLFCVNKPLQILVKVHDRDEWLLQIQDTGVKKVKNMSKIHICQKEKIQVALRPLAMNLFSILNLTAYTCIISLQLQLVPKLLLLKLLVPRPP